MPPARRAFGAARGTIRFRGRERVFHCSDTPLGRGIAHEVLSGRSYPILGFAGDVRTILDVGANVGASTLYFAEKYPQSRILAFEPFPESYELLVRNVQDLPEVVTFNFGLLDVDKQAPLYLGLRDSVTSSLSGGGETSPDRPVLVRLREAGAVLAEQNVSQVDLLKIDTEGCELPILRSIASVVARVAVIYVEFHHEADRREIDRTLSATHVLVLGRIDSPHRGELCYALRERVPADIDSMAIVL